MKNLQRLNIEGKYYRVAMAKHNTREDPCELCHFTNDSARQCPRMGPSKVVGDRSPLYCSHYDDFGAAGSAYLIRDTKQGHAEWVARKMGADDE